jgi:hypothetical protein
MNPLESYPKARKVAYQVFWAVSLATGAAQLGFGQTEAGAPQWLTIALSVLPFVGAGIGYTASSNTDTYAAEHGGGDA